MSSSDLEVLDRALEWLSSGHYVLLLTVVRTWGSSPRPIGSIMAIRDDGRVQGSVSGGCIEDDLIDCMRTKTLHRTGPFTLQYGQDAEEAHRFGLPCGGTLELVAEPLGDRSAIDALVQSLRGGLLVSRSVDLRTGSARVDEIKQERELYADERLMVACHGPRYRLIVIGAGQLSRYVAEFALSLDYAVTVCDPREEFMREWAIPGVACTNEMPDDLIVRMKPDARTAVVALTHDPKLDDMALLEALLSPAFYVGAIGSRRNNAARRERLALFDLNEAQIARLHGPIGLHLGARTPPEIALAVLAEMTALRHDVQVLQTHALRDDDLPARAAGAA
jgi:xanthine dehydrogenase accessory factor